jgi:hypothetical protein
MGVFHFMGLGRSPGAVTSAISYLGARYKRWNPEDAEFFATSGEFQQAGKRGDVQALVLFTSPEVVRGTREGVCDAYIDNAAGQSRGNVFKPGEAMKRVLTRVLPADLHHAAGGRNEVALYWCEIDRTNLHLTFERVAQVMYAAKPPGEVGKEVWINLTGGTNIVNLALQLAASLLTGPARLYYLRADDARCLRHTLRLDDIRGQDNFWVEMPVIYLRLDDATRHILEALEALKTSVDDAELLSRLKNHFWEEFGSLELTEFRRNYLQPLGGQQLVSRPQEGKEHVVAIGQQWTALKHYYDVVARLRQAESDAATNLTALAAAHQDWFHAETIAW